MSKKKRRLLFLGASFGSVALAFTLILIALNSSVSYFYVPSELAKEDPKPTTTIRLGGLVAAGSVIYDQGDKTLVRFSIEDGDATIPVAFKGILPDLFREGQGVIAQGRLENDGSFAASQVLAKHDETYMPREVAEKLKEQGVWQGDD